MKKPATIHIEKLDIEAVIGAFEWERELTQLIRIDVEMDCDIAKASGSDDLRDALDYKQVARRLTEWTQEGGFQLVEALAEHLAERLLEEFATTCVRLRLTKPGAVRHSATVGVTLERRRS